MMAHANLLEAPSPTEAIALRVCAFVFGLVVCSYYFIVVIFAVEIKTRK